VKFLDDFSFLDEKKSSNETFYKWDRKVGRNENTEIEKRIDTTSIVVYIYYVVINYHKEE
jgi:hypothetical protein